MSDKQRTQPSWKALVGLPGHRRRPPAAPVAVLPDGAPGRGAAVDDDQRRLSIAALRDRLDLLDTVAGWLRSAFLEACDSGLEQARSLLADRIGSDPVQQAFVALCDGAACGTVSLVWDEHPLEAGRRCCMAGLYVPPAWRSLGIGRRLCAHALAHAARLGLPDVLLFTPDAEDYYAVRGWRTLRHAAVATARGLQWCAVMQAFTVSECGSG